MEAETTQKSIGSLLVETSEEPGLQHSVLSEKVREQGGPQTYLQVDNPRHDERGNEEVSHGEADDQVVGGGLQSLLTGHGHAHQHVAKDDDEDEQREQHGVVVVVWPAGLSFGPIEGPAPVLALQIIIIPGQVQWIHRGSGATGWPGSGHEKWTQGVSRGTFQSMPPPTKDSGAKTDHQKLKERILQLREFYI